MLDPRQYDGAVSTSIHFTVACGTTARLLDAAEDREVPLLPGADTPSNAMAVTDHDFRLAKFFPAEPSGGAAWPTAVGAPLPQLQFLPTGGITPAMAPRYLALANVFCIGGSWMAGRATIATGDWAASTRPAAALRADRSVTSAQRF